MKHKRETSNRIYLDYAAATPLADEVYEAMLPYFKTQYGNPSAFHEEGRLAAFVIQKARKEVAQTLSVRIEEITFVSGGTEANNLALFGILEKTTIKSPHIIISAIEHPSIYSCIEKLEKAGASVSVIGVDREGIINLSEFKDALRKETVLVSVMYVNSEIGVIQPINAIAKLIRKHRKEHNSVIPFFHTDASQAPLYLLCTVVTLGVDLMTLDGQKIYGPKGVGVLIHKKEVPLSALFCGGGQEEGLRSGTENTPLVVGFAKALARAQRDYKKRAEVVRVVRDTLSNEIRKHIPSIKINGSEEKRIANNLHVSVANADAEYLVAYLDAQGIAASSKSACLTSHSDSSYVLEAIEGLEEGGVRFSLGEETTKEEMKYVAEVLAEAVSIAQSAPHTNKR